MGEEREESHSLSRLPQCCSGPFFPTILCHLVIHLWTKSSKCCVNSANHVKEASLSLFISLNRKTSKMDFFKKAFECILFGLVFNETFNEVLFDH